MTSLIASDNARALLNLIDRSGAAPLLDDLVRTDRRGKKPGIGARTFLLGALLAVHETGKLMTTNIHSVLTSSLAVDLQRELGIRDGDGELLVSLHTCNYYVKTLVGKINYTDEYCAKYLADVPSGERDRRRLAVDELCQALLDATILQDIPIETVAIDETAVWSWQQAPLPGGDPDESIAPDGHSEDGDPVERDGTANRASGDPDVRVGVKTATAGGREYYFGYAIHAITTAAPATGEGASPLQVLAARVTPATTEVVSPTFAALDAAVQRHGSIKELLVDRHYSYKSADRWAQPLLARGLTQVFDMHAGEQTGFRDYEGMRVADGTPHCPATPDNLGTITRPGPGASKEARKEFNAQIDLRQPYAMQRLNVPNSDGKVRWQCPALAGTAGCPLRPGTEQAALEGIRDGENMTIIHEPPTGEHLPKCCTQKTVSTNETIIKLFQRHYWGSKEWTKAYNKRTYVEGFFGLLKNASLEGVSRGQIRTKGLATHQLYLSIALASANVRALIRWYDRRPELDRPDWVPATDAELPVQVSQREYVLLRQAAAELAAAREAQDAAA